MSDPRSLDAATLLAQQPWVERLARGLVHDSSLAQDLAQEAWLRASAKGPDDPGALRGFLASVVRNLKRSNRRGERRRSERETRAARAEALPSSAELVERAELQRILVESVLALEESERTAVLLRYFEGLSAEEIARRSDVPPGTVRSRVSRGLEKLRARLEARVDRRDLFAGLITLARVGPGGLAVPASNRGPGSHGGPGAPAAPWSATLPIGVLAMKLTTLVAGCAALLALALGIWTTTRDGGSARGAGHEPTVPPVAHESAPHAAELAPVASAEARAALPATPAAEAAPAPQPVEAPRATHVVARVVDERGSPLAGVSARRDGEPAGSSAADGSLALELVPRATDELVMLELHRSGFARARRGVRLAAGAEVNLGEIALSAAAPLRGWVEDERGQRLSGVRLMSTGLENPRTDREEMRRHGPLEEDGSVTGVSGPDGGFELADVPLGPARLWAGSEVFAWSSLGPLDVAPGGLANLVLTLRPLDSLDVIRGHVLSPEREPLAHVDVDYWFSTATYSTGSSVRTDDDGAFEILMQQRVAHDLTAGDPENRWSEVYLDGVEPGAQDVELVFEPARWMDVVARDPNGAPIDDFTLQLEGRTEHNWLRMTPRCEAPREGRTRLRLPTASFSLTIGAPGREQLVRGPFTPENAPAELVLELAALPGVHGIILTSTGEPAAGAEVGLYATIPDKLKVVNDGFRLTTRAYTETKATTDAAGGFVLYPPFARPGEFSSGQFVLRATAPGYAPTELGPRPFDPHVGLDLELRLQRGGAIEGRARTAAGVDPTGLLLAFHRGDGRILTQRLGPDGLYRMEHLTSGPWEVRALDDEQYGNRSSSTSTLCEDGAPPFDNWSCTVVDCETTRYDLDLGERAPCALRGVLVLSGRTTEGWTASLEVDRMVQDEVLGSVVLDAQGRFELGTPRGGGYRLVLRGPEEASGRLELTEQLELHPGENEWRLALELAQVAGGGALGHGTREHFYAYQWLGTVPGHALQASIRILPGADGGFVLPAVPAGRGKIQRNVPPANGQEIAPWEDLLEFELAPGEVRRIDLP